MAKYRKKPVIIKAEQWFKNGDHSEDNASGRNSTEVAPFAGEGQVVRYYRRPNIDGSKKCFKCKKLMHKHGFIDTLEGGHIVCPGDWIITSVQGEKYPIKDKIFKETMSL